MTRARCTRSSKRKPDASSQESLPEDCKENSPFILSQASSKANNVHNKFQPKENTPLKKITPLGTSAGDKENVLSPVRKSVRSSKVTGQKKISKFQSPKSILSDRTNTPSLRETREICLKKNNLLENQQNKNICAAKLTPSIDSQNIPKNGIHIPVYKTVSPLVTPKRKNLPPEKKEAMYEFEVDENEEPVPKRKRKKRTYVRKPKLCPKALTINNIKYSSTESLASLPEKPVKQKNRKKPAKSSLKPYSSTTTLNNQEDSRVTVDSFISHPPSMLLCENRPESRNELSVLRETISEEFQSPVVKDPSPPITNKSSLSISNTMNVPNVHHSHFSPNPRCYSSKHSRTPNPHSETVENSYLGENVSFPHHLSSCSVNSPRAHDFLSSTPCKRSSLVVQNNSVFDESHDTNASSHSRSSVGINHNNSAAQIDKCFGFDEPEEVEEPLVSPIKTSIDLIRPERQRVVPLRLHRDEPRPKPSAEEVIEMLKATLPKTKDLRESTEPFDSSFEETSQQLSPTTCEEKETPVFKKPPRRSYERQRKVRWDSEHEESDEEIVEKEKIEEIEPQKPVKKCYKKVNKANTTKTAKAPKPTKAKQKLAKEEEELERLAAQMNAQFQEIDKVNLMVE